MNRTTPTRLAALGKAADDIFLEADPVWAILGSLIVFGFGLPLCVVGDLLVITDASQLWQNDRLGLLILACLGVVFTVFTILFLIALTLYWAGAWRGRR